MLFKEKLKSNSKIFLDGGNGSEIAKLGGEMSPAFSALASISSPEIVIKVHEKFIDAGCDLITANTFSSTRHNLESINRGDEVKEFIIQSLKLSRQAIKNKGKESKIGVAGSLSNFFSLKENEFVPNPKYIPSFKQEEQNYKEAAKILKEEGVDILILEIPEVHNTRSSFCLSNLIIVKSRANKKLKGINFVIIFVIFKSEYKK